jgi:hypothetical protein
LGAGGALGGAAQGLIIVTYTPFVLVGGIRRRQYLRR